MLHYRYRLLVLFAIHFLTLGVCRAADFPSCSQQMKISFSGCGTPEASTNFPALIVLNRNRPDFRYSNFATPGAGDLRFPDATQTNELNYETETWDTNGDSLVWVLVPRLEGTPSVFTPSPR